MSRSRRPVLAWPLPVALARRYLRSGRRDAYVSLLSALAVGGIALGVAALVLVLAGLSGLQSFLRDDVLARTPHLEIELPPGADVAAATSAVEAVPGVVSVRRLLRGRAWMLVGDDSIHVDVTGFEGVLPDFFPRLEAGEEAAREVPGTSLNNSSLSNSSLSNSIIAPDEVPGTSGDTTYTVAERGVFLGEATASRWALERGQLIELVSPRPTLTPFGPQPRLVPVRLQGVFDTGRTEADEPRVAVSLAVAERLFGSARAQLEVRAEGLDEALTLAPRLRQALEDAAVGGAAVEGAAAEGEGGAEPLVRTWSDLNRGLFFALKLEKTLMFVSVFLIVPIAAMALVTVLALMISAKRAEIGMLHAMGATPRQVEQVFLALGGALAALGLGLGFGAGIFGAWALDRFELVTPPGTIYFLDHVPFDLRARDLATVLGATLLFTLGSTVYAARKASTLEPTEALRTP